MVLYLRRLPHGFYEDQLKVYLSQFGTVTRLRLSRNQKVPAAPQPVSAQGRFSGQGAEVFVLPDGECIEPG